MTRQVLIADSVSPLTQIPMAFRRDPAKGVLLYADGTYQLPGSEAHIFPHREWISTLPYYPGQAKKARFLDVERFDATASDFPPFRAERNQLIATSEVDTHAGVYCSIDPGAPYGVRQIIDACHQAGQGVPEHWWIAWYPGWRNAPAIMQVRDEIEALTGEEIQPATIYACQWQTGHYDLSIVYQHPGWSPVLF